MRQKEPLGLPGDLIHHVKLGKLHSLLQSRRILQDFQGESFLLSRVSEGKVTNLDITLLFSEKYVLNPTSIAQFIKNKPISYEIFVSVQSWTAFFTGEFTTLGPKWMTQLG